LRKELEKKNEQDLRKVLLFANTVVERTEVRVREETIQEIQGIVEGERSCAEGDWSDEKCKRKNTKL